MSADTVLGFPSNGQDVVELRESLARLVWYNAVQCSAVQCSSVVVWMGIPMCVCGRGV